MKIGDIITVRAEKVCFGGDAIAHHERQVIFIPRLLVGEAARIRIVGVKNDFLRGQIVEILEVSPFRVTPECRYFGVCPGCTYQHVSGEAELKIKSRQLKEMLLKIMPREEVLAKARPAVAPGDLYHYRNKITLHCTKIGPEPRLGYVGPDKRSIIDLESCPLARREINTSYQELRKDPGFFHTLHDRMNITFRYTDFDQVVYWRNTPGREIPETLTESLNNGEIRFSVPPSGFYQVNQAGAQYLFDRVGELVRESQASTVVDAYCGAGFFGCAAAAAGVKQVYGVEIEPLSVEAARQNLQQWPETRSEILAGDAAKILPELLNRAGAEALVIVDPPRGGLSSQAVRTLEDAAKLIYVSCHPATLVRDLERLQRKGFEIVEYQLVDQFRRCLHFETIVVLEKK